MSSPGFFMDDADYAKQRLAQALMQNQNPNMQQPFSGIANAGSSILGAIAARDAKNSAMGKGFMDQRMSAAPMGQTQNSMTSPNQVIQTQVTGQKSWNPQTGQLYSLGASL